MTTGDYDDLEELMHVEDDRLLEQKMRSVKKMKSHRKAMIRRHGTRRQLDAQWRRQLHAYNASQARDR
jgi:hypothetical protein